MANFTPNYNLRKPVGTEQFDIDRDFNANWDAIDGELKERETGITALEADKANKADTYTKAEVDGKDALKADKTTVEALDSRVDTIITTPAESVSDQEIIDARQGKASLGANITDVKTSLAQIPSEIKEVSVDNKVDIRKQIKPMVTFTWDDGKIEEWQVKDIFASKGVPYVVAMVAGRIGSPGYMTYDQLLELQNNYGCEISSHTMNHLDNLTGQNYTTIDYELGESHRLLNLNGLKCDTICIPHGRYNDTVQEIAKKHYKAMRVSIQGLNKPPIPTFQLTEELFGESGIPAHNTLDYYKSCVDKAIAENGWLIFLGHGYFTMTSPTEQTNLAALIDYIKGLNVDIVTMSTALEHYGNIVQSGDVKEQFYKKSKHLKHFALGADGSVSSNYANVRYLKKDSILSTTPITSFEDDCISIAQVSAISKAGFPKESSGTVYTYRFDANINYSFQEYFIYGTTDRWTRKLLADGNWDSWLPEVTSIVASDSILPTTIPSALFLNRVTYCVITSGNKAGFPDNVAGLIENHMVMGANNWGYCFQIYNAYATGSIYKRVATDANTWGAWQTVYKAQGNLATNGFTATSLPNEYPTNQIYRTIINGTNKMGFPENSSGMLEHNSFGSFSDYNYVYQTYHIYGSPKLYKRSATSATTWGEWTKISVI